MGHDRQASTRWLERLSQLTERQHAVCVAGGLLVALVVRVVVLSGLKATLYWDGLSPDEDTYHKWAERFAAGTEVASFAPDFPRLPARVFGWVYAISGAHTSHLRFFNLALGVAACALVYAIGRALFGRGVGLCALLLAAFSESLAFYSATALHTLLGVVLTGLLIWILVDCLQRPARGLHARFAGAGALLGLLVNTRGNAVVLGLAMVPIAIAAARSLGRDPKLLAAQLLGVLLAGYLVAASISGGVAGPRSAFNLYLGNNAENPTPYFRPVRFTSSAPEYQATGFALEAARRAGEPLSLDRAERFWVSAVIGDALAHPGDALARGARKLLAVVHSSPSDNNLDLRMFRGAVPALALCLPTWLLLALGIASAWLLPRDRRLALGAGVLALYAGSIALFFAGERLRVPLLMIALPFAAAGIAGLARAARVAQLRWAATLAVLALVAHAPLRGASDLSGAYNMHALLLLGRGEEDESARWYRRSLALDELDSPGARIGLAAILQKQGRLEEAVKVLEPLPDTHYEAASKQEWLGNLGLMMREPRAAAAAYAKAIELDSSKRNAYQGLFIASRMLGDEQAARAIDARLRALPAPE